MIVEVHALVQFCQKYPDFPRVLTSCRAVQVR